MYNDVRQTWTKQFIYVMRLDSTLTLASPQLPYPKPSNEYPITTREEIYKQNDEVFNNYKTQKREPVYYYYEKDKLLFTRKTLRRRGELNEEKLKPQYAQYDVYGHLEKTGTTIASFVTDSLNAKSLGTAFKEKRFYKNKYFTTYAPGEDIPEEIEVPIIAIIEEIPFPRVQDVANYLGISRQAVS